MTRAIRRDWPWWLAALAGTALMSWVGLTGFAWSDYDNEVAPAMRTFAGGDIAGFLAQAPSYGGSLILRSPSAAALLGGAAMYLLAHVAFRYRHIHTLNTRRTALAVLLVAFIPAAVEIAALITISVLAAALAILIVIEKRSYGESRGRMRQEVRHATH